MLKRVMRLDVLVACFYMHVRRLVSRFDAKAGQELSGYDLYESLLTYVAHMDLVRDPLQDTCHAHASKILITKIRRILYVGYRRIFP